MDIARPHAPQRFIKIALRVEDRLVSATRKNERTAVLVENSRVRVEELVKMAEGPAAVLFVRNRRARRSKRADKSHVGVARTAQQICQLVREVIGVPETIADHQHLE